MTDERERETEQQSIFSKAHDLTQSAQYKSIKKKLIREKKSTRKDDSSLTNTSENKPSE